MLKEKTLNIAIYIFGFMAFAGAYAGFLFAESLVSLPGGLFRILILGSLFFMFFRIKKKSFQIIELLFLVFSFFYIERILLDLLKDVNYYTSLNGVLINFILGGLIPIVLLGKIRFTDRVYTILVKSFIASGIVFGAAVLIYYGKYIGEVSRLSAMTTGDDSIINPLNLSYISSMSICVSYMFLKNEFNFKNKFILLIIILTSIPAFFLGASRGAVISLVFPFLFMYLSHPTLKKTFKFIIVLFIVGYLTVELTQIFDSNIIDRFSTLTEGKSSANDKEDRLYIWKKSFNEQFLEKPIFGDSIKTNGINSYVHNLFVEALQTTGLLGGIPLIILVILCLKKSFIIFRYYPKYAWIATFFLCCFIQSMFSFSIYSNKWIWISVGLLASVQISNNEKILSS